MNCVLVVVLEGANEPCLGGQVSVAFQVIDHNLPVGIALLLQEHQAPVLSLIDLTVHLYGEDIYGHNSMNSRD
jgi:hypothetical protein